MLEVIRESDGTVRITPITENAGNFLDALYNAYKQWEEQHTVYYQSKSYMEWHNCESGPSQCQIDLAVPSCVCKDNYNDA